MVKKSTKGFTLIELLVVIAIIGILSSVVLASMNSARKKSRDARRQQDLKGLSTALELYYDQNGHYPTVTTSGGGIVDADSTASVLQALKDDNFINSIANDPSPTGNYKYVSDTDGTVYCIGATMEGTAPSPADTCTTAMSGGLTGPTYKVGP